MKRRGVSIKSISIVLITVAFIIMFMSFLVPNIQAKSSTPSYKYYTSVLVESGDTLWTIADEYSCIEYKNKNDFVKEVITLNGIKDDTIYAGQYITIPYYSQEVM